jgi:spermidine synthase
MKKYLLEYTVFIGGSVVMIFELVGSRLIGPYFGTSIYIWTSLIGVILGSLSLGYWWGGKIADKKGTLEAFSFIVLLSGIAVGLTSFFKDVVFWYIQQSIPDAKWGSLFSSLVLFALPSILLGMISPYAAKLKLNSLNTSGTTVGNLYAISTVGSITGTFLAGFVLIPFLGSTRIIFIISVVLILNSLFIYPKKFLKIKLFFTIIFISSYTAINPLQNYLQKNGSSTFESSYNYITIYTTLDNKTQQEARVLKINNEYSSAMFLDNDDLVFDYTKFYHLAEHFKPNFKTALMLGGAGYSYPKEYLKKFPSSTLDVVEIDPKLTELAYQHFKLTSNPHLNIHHEDGRVFVNQNSKKYDVIFGDAFQSFHSIPFQLTTQEAINKYYRLLNDDGVMIVNIISAINGPRGEFLRAEVATFKKIFPAVYLFPVTDPENGEKVQNIMLVALKSSAPPIFKNSDPTIQSYLDHLWKKEVSLDVTIITDDHAPVDYYVNKIISS